MSDFLKRLSRDPYAPIDGASVVSVDELGNGYDYRGQLIAPAYVQPEQTWGETALGVATAPARLATALAGSLSPYGADGWQVPPIVSEGVDALTAVGDAYQGKMAPEDVNARALGMAGFMMGGGGLAARPAGGTGMFAGRLAKTADHEALARAERMAAEGVAGLSADQAATGTGTSQALRRAEDALSPNPLLSGQTADDLQGRSLYPDGQPAPAGPTLMTDDPFPGSFGVTPDEIELLRGIYSRYGKLPSAWYVHGRAQSEKLRSDVPIQMTKNFNVMEQYGQRSGSGWAIAPADGAKVMDFTDISTPDMRSTAAKALTDYRSGRLPYEMEQDISWTETARAKSEMVRSAFAPDDIVSGAGAYDAMPYSEWLYNRLSPDFIHTPDGAVAFNGPGIKAVRLFSNSDSRPALLAGMAGQEETEDGYADGGRVGFAPKYLVLHDYGGNPANRDGVFNPYHVLVFPDGSKRYRYPDDPYGRKAPHAFRLNPESVGISYAGDVGSQPTAAAMETLRNEAKAVAEMFPGIVPMGHGEAFQATRGTNRQASRDGRDLEEASWRSNILYGPPAPGQTQVVSAPVPMAKRGLTSFAGLEPSTAPVVRPLPSPAQSLAAAEMDAEPTPVAEEKPSSFDFMKLASLFAEPEQAQAPQINFTPIQAFQSQGSPIQASTPYRGTFADGGQVRGLPDQSEPLHAGPLHSTVPGRTDHLPITVAAGSFVLPADVVSGLGEGNTNAGMQAVSEMFPLPPVRRSDGGRVPIAAAGGEYVIAPETVAALGGGDLEAGHELLDDFVLRTRANTIQRLRALPSPEK